MLGKDYDSLTKFKLACDHYRNPLAPEPTLSKVYQVAQLRHIAEKAGIDLSVSSLEDGCDRRSGIGSRYNTATQLSEECGNDPESLGEILARWDHDLFFPIVTYRRFPSSMAYASPETLLTFINPELLGHLRPGFTMRHNGFRWPHGRSPELESVLVDVGAGVLSLLFSCTRILLLPDQQAGSVENYFLARIPVLVRLLFHHGLCEISMPSFSEVQGVSDPATSRVPERYQVLIDTTIAALLQILPDRFYTIDFRRLALYLELVLGAEDMGWIIEPQHAATFDLTGIIPLKKVLDSLSADFRAECERQEISSHPLAQADFYKIFRALREQSYTYSLLFRAPIGPREGSYRISTLYGPENLRYEPILWILDINRAVAEAMRCAVQISQSVNLNNPYDLASLLR